MGYAARKHAIESTDNKYVAVRMGEVQFVRLWLYPAVGVCVATINSVAIVSTTW